MNPLLSFIAQKIWERLEPWLIAKWEEVKPKIFELIKEQFKEWLPQILKTVTVGMASSAGQLTVNTTDRVTDIIPGKVDDVVVDTIVDHARDRLRQFGIEF